MSSVEIENEIVYVANVEKSQIYTLDGVGLIIWELLETPLSLTALVTEISEIYDVSRKIIEESISSFLIALIDQGLIEKMND
ncbi:PqqD family protein [Rothia sp. SD9660Na]|uniref:PqqD family protein n=1 Tax=Rothia sp. SD9660Na TaxID=3047030 RepID=UPI0024BA6207|nr:PqqD family protein [Rothia sp. SD9660Na]WHS50012.1 PqqD family protein [Rothia sp. SD9660Na]